MNTFLLYLLVAPLVFAAAYYGRLGLAYLDIFWTIVESGWVKIVLHNGEYSKTLKAGLRWLGLPGVDTLYSRTMTFLKGVVAEDGTVTVVPHDDKGIKQFKTTIYPYAIPFKDEEDCRGLPLTGVGVVNGRMVDGEKLFFIASDWYATVLFLVRDCLRDLMTTTSYEAIYRQVAQGPGQADDRDVSNQVSKKISQLFWEKMNAPGEGVEPSVVSILLDKYGFQVDSVKLASIDPPAWWRETSLAPYKAQKEMEAAEQQAKASATLFDDTSQALKAWLKDQRENGHNPTQDQIDAKQDELRQRALAKTQGYQQIHIKGLEQASTAVVGGGGGTGVLIGGQQGGGNKPKEEKKSKALPMTKEEADQYFRLYGKYPKSDPEGRTPN